MQLVEMHRSSAATVNTLMAALEETSACKVAQSLVRTALVLVETWS
jgi:hypothetical protein